MTKICPACGSKAVDDQSQFCNKCGYPFPPPQAKKTVVVRTEPRLTESLPTPPRSPPGDETRRPPRAPQNLPVRPKALPLRPLPFRKLLGRSFIRPVYWLGVIMIVLVVFTGITADLSKKGTDTSQGTGTKSGSMDLLSGLPVFWIIVLVLGNLAWRLICELSAVQAALYDALSSAGLSRGSGGQDPHIAEDDMDEGAEAGGETVECLRCGKIVPVGELRSCDRCGVQGCSNCIRVSGLVRKTMTCKECFEGK